MNINHAIGYWKAVALYKDGTQIKKYYPYTTEEQKHNIECKLLEKEGCVYHSVQYVDEKI
jgi:hypothetical protein